MERAVKRRRLGEILIEQGRLTREALEKSLEIQQREGGLIGEILVHHRFVREEDVAVALATQFNFPYLALENFTINPQALQAVPASLAVKYVFMPIDKINNILTVVMADPTQEAALREIESVTRCRVQAFVGTLSEVRHAIQRYYRDTALRSGKDAESNP